MLKRAGTYVCDRCGSHRVCKDKKRLADAGFGEDILTIRLQNFCTIDEIAKEAGGFDFVLADLGVSSMQIDNPDRGFSFKVDGPLDLRLNPERESVQRNVWHRSKRTNLQACSGKIPMNHMQRNWHMRL